MTESDRELAREWAEREYGPPDRPGNRNEADAFLAGLEHGRLTWTGEPPAESGQWWWCQLTPDVAPQVVMVAAIEGETDDLDVIGWNWRKRLSYLMGANWRKQASCQWSSAPIPHPAPREPT